MPWKPGNWGESIPNSRWEGLDKKADETLRESWKNRNSLQKKQDAHKSFQHPQKKQSLARCLQHKKPKVYGIAVLIKQHCSLFVQMYLLHSLNSSNKILLCSYFIFIQKFPFPHTFFYDFSFLWPDNTWSHCSFLWAYQSIKYFRFGFAIWANTRYSFIFYSQHVYWIVSCLDSSQVLLQQHKWESYKV